jgi:hypothetical protein
MKWPFWFPYPSSWLRAFASTLWAGCFLYIFWMLSAWGWILSEVTKHSIILPVLLLAGCLAGACAYAQICDVFIFKMHHRRSRFVSRRAFWEGCLSLLIPILATFNMMVMFFPIYDSRIRYASDSFLFVMYGLIYLGSVILYQIECLARLKLSTVFKKKSQAKPKYTQRRIKIQPIDSIEQELNQLKGASGLTSMKDIRTASSKDSRKMNS